jgi:hypothetical protein
MDYLRILRALCVGLSAVGLLLPTSVLEAAAPGALANDVKPRATLVNDVELDAAGSMHGLVVDVQGARAVDREVVVRQPGREVARTRTDAMGRFRIGPLRGGMYQLSVDGGGRMVRAWAANTAPPAAEKTTLVVIGGEVIRGQMPLECFFGSDAVIIAGLVAAMIILPIALSGSKPHSP